MSTMIAKPLLAPADMTDPDKVFRRLAELEHKAGVEKAKARAAADMLRTIREEQRAIEPIAAEYLDQLPGGVIQVDVWHDYRNRPYVTYMDSDGTVHCVATESTTALKPLSPVDVAVAVAAHERSLKAVPQVTAVRPAAKPIVKPAVFDISDKELKQIAAQNAFEDVLTGRLTDAELDRLADAYGYNPDADDAPSLLPLQPAPANGVGTSLVEIDQSVS